MNKSVRWGLAGGIALTTVGEVAEVGRWAAEVGFHSYWVSQANAVDPLVALAAAAPALEGLAEVGTSVVPLYGRHPVGLAQQARTAQSALGGRLTLGVGPSHRSTVENNLGLSWDHAFAYTRDFLAGLQPLLAGEPAEVDGERVTTRAALNIDAAPTPVLLAALGPRMLTLAGQTTDGTTVGQCGPRTLAEHVVPRINEAAAGAGRPAPRVVALVRICVADSGPTFEAARQQAREVAGFYSAQPSYRAVLDREGLADPADIHLIGSPEQVLDGLGAYVDAGATDLRVEVVAPDEASTEATKAALAGFVAEL